MGFYVGTGKAFVRARERGKRGCMPGREGGNPHNALTTHTPSFEIYSVLVFFLKKRKMQ